VLDERPSCCHDLRVIAQAQAITAEVTRHRQRDTRPADGATPEVLQGEVEALSGLLAERDRLVEEQASAIPRFEDPARPRHRAARLMGSRHRTGAGFTLSGHIRNLGTRP